MKLAKKALLTALISLVFGFQATVGFGQDADINFDTALAEQLQFIIAEEHLFQNLIGLSAAVILPGEEMWQGATGSSAAGKLMKADMRFGIASIKKTFVASIILLLAEEGILTVDDSLGKWLPRYEFINPEITLAQLLRHRSGIYNYTEHPAFWNSYWSNPNKNWDSDELIDTFVSVPIFAPGSRYSYSNTNFLLLSKVIKVATGTSVLTQYKNRLWNPQNLANTFLIGKEPITGVIAHNWTDWHGASYREDVHELMDSSSYSMLWPAVYSTAGDLAMWAKALYGGQVLAPSSLDQMLTFTEFENETWTGYGMAVQRAVFHEEEFLGHTGLIPGYKSMMMYCPRTGVSICVLGNQDEFLIQQIFERLVGAVKEYQSRITNISPESELDQGNLISSNYPNPFAKSTTISFVLPDPEFVTIEVFDLFGKKITTIAKQFFPAGEHKLNWETGDIAAGVYIYRIAFNGFNYSGKMVVQN